MLVRQTDRRLCVCAVIAVEGLIELWKGFCLFVPEEVSPERRQTRSEGFRSYGDLLDTFQHAALDDLSALLEFGPYVFRDFQDDIGIEVLCCGMDETNYCVEGCL